MYLIDASCFNSFAREFGIGRYAYYLANALYAVRDELEPDERLLAAVRMHGAGAVTADLRLDRHSEAVCGSYRDFVRSRRRHLRRTIRESGADMVHLLEGPQAVFLPGIPSVVTCHDLIPLIFPHDYLSSLFHQLRRRARDYLSYSGARRIIAISETTADLLVEVMQIPRERISVVLQGLDHQRFHPREEPGERDRLDRALRLPRRYALYVGATDPRKRVELLVDCYRSVFRATGVPLVLVGTEFDDPINSVRRAIADAAAGSVLAVGKVGAEHLPALYRHADVHVLPSVYEGFGLTVLEAMASGCPVITTRGGALGEVAGEAARFVTPDSATDLEGALVDLLRDESARERLARRGIEQASKFTWERTARQTLAVYRKACGRQPSVRAAGNGEPARMVEPGEVRSPLPERRDLP